MVFDSTNFLLIVLVFTLLLPGILLIFKTKNLKTNKSLNILLIAGAIFAWTPYLLTLTNPAFHEYLSSITPIATIYLIIISSIKIYLIIKAKSKG